MSYLFKQLLHGTDLCQRVAAAAAVDRLMAHLHAQSCLPAALCWAHAPTAG